jgi:CubicO group peptidase (beta-lactamase class C family)
MRTVWLMVGLALAGCASKYGCQERGRSSSVAVVDFGPVSRRIQTWVDSNYYSGASILVAQNNTVLYEQYFGDHTPETQVYIASAGKWLAAAAIAAVVAEGELTWDDKVVKWLPEFRDEKGQATLRQLLAHTSGYPDYQPPGKRHDDYQSLEEAVRHITYLPAYAMPGTSFRYGGLAMQVAGRMAELATGKDWETLFQEKIAMPLGMKHTHFTPVDTAEGHNPMVGGGARSTLHDYARFLEMILNKGLFRGNRILPASAVCEIMADQVRGAIVPHGEYVERARGLTHSGIYGLGVWREIVSNKGQAVLISSPSWAGAYPWIDKENNIYGFFLAHVNVAEADKDKFSSFYASPVLPAIIRDIIETRHANLDPDF